MKLFRKLYWIIPIVIAVYFRFGGLDWDDTHLLNPDERFLVQVTEAGTLPGSISEWLDPQNSPLNPNNYGFDFYVYGTLPLLLVKTASGILADVPTAGLIGWTGRFLSGFFDILTLLCIGIISGILWKNRKSGLLSMLGYAFFVSAIQQSHFYTVDTAAVFFCTASGLISLLLWQETRSSRFLLETGLGGVFLGCALACKISAGFFILFPCLVIFFRFLKPEEAKKHWRYCLSGGFVLLLIFVAFTFRIFQPYAFQTNNLLNFSLNPQWLAGIRELSRQSGGFVAFPPAWQWADRPFYFVFKNLALYGLGIPMTGILCWGLIQTCIITHRERNRFLMILLSGVFLFFIWQSTQFSQMMRYCLPICPLLFVLSGSIFADRYYSKRIELGKRILAGFLLLAALLWAEAFSSIYHSPHTRIQASEWIYANIPSAVQAVIRTASGDVTRQIGIPSFQLIGPDNETLIIPFRTKSGDDIQMAELGTVKKLTGSGCRLAAGICLDSECKNILDSAIPLDESGMAAGGEGSGIRFFFPAEKKISDNTAYGYLALTVTGKGCSLRISGESEIYLLHDQQPAYTLLDGLIPQIRENEPLEFYFESEEDGFLQSLVLSKIVWQAESGEPVDLEVEITNYDNGEKATAVLTLQTGSNPLAESGNVKISFQEPLPVIKGDGIGLKIRNQTPGSSFSLAGTRIASESNWDELLPLPQSAKLPYDMTVGLYGEALDLDLFANEDILQREKLLSRIEAADYLIISSNRIYASASRIKEKFPLLDAFYRQIINCPESQSIAACCADISTDDSGSGRFFKIAAVFESEPALFGFKINTQLAEEAFTVYDHPKVIILEKKANFNLSEFRKGLDPINLSVVSNKNPVEYRNMENPSLILTSAQAAIQQAGGTWSSLFHRTSLINQNQFVGTIVWLLLFWVIGWIFYPLSRIVFGSLRDKGYGISKFFGLLWIGYIVWICAFSGIPYSRQTIAIVISLAVLGNLIIALRNRKQIILEIRENSRYILQSELVFLAFFLFFLMIRLGNPDLWHPYKGGEKPMDFSYFNAVLKSTVFPPYDPWFAGGTLNYYYYGFFLSGLPVKLIGMIPSIAYNLILPTWYGFLAVGAYTAGAGIYAAVKNHNSDPIQEKKASLAGLMSVFMLQVIGNLGTVKILLDKTTELGAGGAEGGGLQKIGWFFSGIAKLISGQHFQMYRGDWYWLPSRAIPGEPITEFPFFTFLYGDPHAHLFALPITVLVLVWIVAMLNRYFNGRRPRFSVTFLSIFSGALLIGALIPTNTWDMPTYLLLAVVVLSGIGIRTPIFEFSANRPISEKSNSVRQKIISSVLTAGLLCGLTFLLYKPYLDTNYRDSAIELWQGDRTPLWSYWMHWGFFLFAFISWYTAETINWMSSVRYVDFRKFLKENRNILALAVFVMGSILIFFSVKKVVIAWTAIPVMIWSGLLLLRRNTSSGKRLLYFLIGTGMFITLFVEMFCLHGDLGRMNMVFKLYSQGWVILSISAACAMMFSLEKIKTIKKSSRFVRVWNILAGFLIIGTLSYPIFASADKIKDRMSETAPHTLDGMEYMKTSQYFQDGFLMDLSQDYAAIQWMQDNVEGSPVIVEGNATEYKWGTRFTVYTGLPGVVGWNYHQRQQRGNLSDQVWERVNAIGSFYNSVNLDEAVSFLQKYNVSYIIVGQMERGMYSPEGIEKFEQGDGIFWDEVYQERDTAIYKVRN